MGFQGVWVLGSVSPYTHLGFGVFGVFVLGMAISFRLNLRVWTFWRSVSVES